MRHRTTSAARALLALGLATGIGTLGATASYAGVRQAGPVKVTGTSANKYDPADIKATADAAGKVTIEFTSQGLHTIQSDEAKFDSGGVQDTKKTITFTAKPGTYAVYCLYHKSIGMTATLTVAGAGAGNPDAAASATAPAKPPASASASASVGAPQPGAGAPTPTASGSASAEGVPGVAGNKTLESIEEERAAQHGAVSGFRFFTIVACAFLVILGVAVLFSTRPRRAAGR
jgi:plastocyanin